MQEAEARSLAMPSSTSWGMREEGRETVVPTTMAINPPLTAANNCGSKAGRDG